MNSVLLQVGASGNGGLFLIGGMFVVMYFFMIRPQQKKQKDAKKFRESLKKGEEIVTIGGIYGKIAEVQDDKIIIEVDRGTKLTVDKSSISGPASAGKK